LAVTSAQPSATTITSVAIPHTVVGSPSTTWPTEPSSLYAAITIATGGSFAARFP